MNLSEIASNVLAGLVMAVLNITVAISVAAMIFAGTQSEHLFAGVMVLLVGSIVVGLGGTLFSELRGVICGTRVVFAPVLAVVVSGIYAALGGESSEQVLPTMIAAIMAASVVTGIFLLLLGHLRLGNLVRYIPYPVMGGFLAGIGFILVKGGLSVAMGAPVTLDAFLDSQLMLLGAPALFFAVCLYLLLARLDHWLAFPAALFSAFAVFYLILLSSGQSIHEAVRAGWLPQVESPSGIPFPLMWPADLARVNWAMILAGFDEIAVVALLGAIVLLLDTTSIEIVTQQELSPNRELKTMGATNIVAGALGGYPGVHVASDTAFAHKLGGDSRLMGFVYVGSLVMLILVGTDYIGAVPTFILGALLIYIGLDFLIDWTWKARRLLPAADYLIVLAILVVIATAGILNGVAFGFALAVLLFVVRSSRLEVVRSIASGREHAGNVERPIETREFLNQEGERILIVSLQGFIFFGTAEKMLNEVRNRIEDKSRTRVEFLVLDFQHVRQLDISAIHAFTKLSRLSEKLGFHIVMSGARSDTGEQPNPIGFLSGSGRWKRVEFDYLDDGIAWCEEVILEESQCHFGDYRKELSDLLFMITEDESLAHDFVPFFEEVTAEKESYLFKQGDRGDSLYIVGDGSVAVVIQFGGRQRVLRRYRPGAVVGEMALYTSEPRTASVFIEKDSLLYRIDSEQLRRLRDKHPEGLDKLHSYIIRMMSERLSRANRALQHV